MCHLRQFPEGLSLSKVKRKLAVCKVTFGAEPKDYEIHDFVTETAKFLPLISKMVFTAYHLKNGLLICGDLRRGIV